MGKFKVFINEFFHSGVYGKTYEYFDHSDLLLFALIDFINSKITIFPLQLRLEVKNLLEILNYFNIKRDKSILLKNVCKIFKSNPSVCLIIEANKFVPPNSNYISSIRIIKLACLRNKLIYNSKILYSNVIRKFTFKFFIISELFKIINVDEFAGYEIKSDYDKLKLFIEKYVSQEFIIRQMRFRQFPEISEINQIRKIYCEFSKRKYFARVFANMVLIFETFKFDNYSEISDILNKYNIIFYEIEV